MFLKRFLEHFRKNDQNKDENYNENDPELGPIQNELLIYYTKHRYEVIPALPEEKDLEEIFNRPGFRELFAGSFYVKKR